MAVSNVLNCDVNENNLTNKRQKKNDEQHAKGVYIQRAQFAAVVVLCPIIIEVKNKRVRRALSSSIITRLCCVFLFVACSVIIISTRDMGANRLGTLNKDAFKGMILLNEL